MSDRQRPYHHTQPRPFHAPSRATPSQQPLYHAPYNTATSAQQTIFQTPNRQLPADPGSCFPFNMPDLSSLTSSALINALITPSTTEHQQQRRGLVPSTPFFDPRAQSARRLRAFEDTPAPHVGLDNQESPFHAQPSRVVPERSSKRQPKRKAPTPLGADDDDDYVEEAQTGALESPQGARKRRRSTRSKKSSTSLNFADIEEDDHIPPRQETKPKRGATAKKQRKERTGRLIRKKPIGMTVPKTLSEAGTADRMMWEWKNQGRNWEEIRAEWKKITGIEPGGSSLSVRYIKLVENLARNGAAGDIELLRFKREAEEELLSHLWTKVAEKMLAYSPESEHNPKDLQKRYSMIVRSGYDVEKLLADDKIKREADHTNEAMPVQDCEDNEYEDGFAMDMQDVRGYDDSIANDAAGHLNQPMPGSSAHGPDNNHYGQDTTPTSEHTAALFDSGTVLHNEVDGLNEQGLRYNPQGRTQGNPEIEALMSSTTFLPTSPFTGHKQAVDDEGEPFLAPVYSLIPYASDSE